MDWKKKFLLIIMTVIMLHFNIETRLELVEREHYDELVECCQRSLTHHINMEVQIPVENISDKQIEIQNEMEQNQQVMNNFSILLT